MGEQEIPMDIRLAARAVLAERSPSMNCGIFDRLFMTIRSQAEDAIAFAILAERNRCAALKEQEKV